MQACTWLNENRGVRALRWVARVLGVISILVLILWMYLSFTVPPGVTPNATAPSQWVIWGFLGIGYVLGLVGDIRRMAVSEIVGGLLLVGVGAWLGFQYVPLQLGQLTAGAAVAVPGALFIICGWYTLAQRSRHAAGATA
jgi:hypothetical protein